MTTTARDLLDQALELPLDDRAQLAVALLRRPPNAAAHVSFLVRIRGT
ncbi:MAG: hypothetical protein ACTHQM_05395 [Thermoanaerobaculia bacterium]